MLLFSINACGLYGLTGVRTDAYPRDAYARVLNRFSLVLINALSSSTRCCVELYGSLNGLATPSGA